MRILVICQYYFPEPFRIADICEEFVRQGHEVLVVTGTPNYPMGEIYPGYENGQKMDEILNGVKIHRCITAPRKTGTLNRLINYFSYPIASKKYIKKLDDSFDVVFVNQLSPVMMAYPGIWYKKKYNKKLVLYCLDLWPESICVGGIRKDSVIYKVFKVISKKVYQAADELLVTSRSFRDYLEDMFSIADEKICYLPQYAEAQFLSLKTKEPGETFNLLFAGNIGTAQSVGTIVDAAKLLQNEDVLFHIVGDGIELGDLKKRAEGLANIVFYGRKSIEEMPKYYEMADAMLVTLTGNPIISFTLPGKVQTYMAAGKPIIGAVDGETAIILEESQGGYYGPAEDSISLANNIKKLIKSGQIQSIGKKNQEYYRERFSKERFIKEILSYFENLINK